MQYSGIIAIPDSLSTAVFMRLASSTSILTSGFILLDFKNRSVSHLNWESRVNRINGCWLKFDVPLIAARLSAQIIFVDNKPSKQIVRPAAHELLLHVLLLKFLSCATYHFHSSAYDCQLLKFDWRNAFRSRFLGFIFKLEYLFVYVSSVKLTDAPRLCRLSRLGIWYA